MKVEQKPKDAFEPIVVTLETKEEATWLWHCLNVTPIERRDYCRRRNVVFPHKLNFDMWKALNNVFAL